jgi:hypothetical protein
MNRIEEKLQDQIISLNQNPLFVPLFDKILKSCFINIIEEENNYKILDSIRKNLKTKEENEFLIEMFNSLMLLIAEIRHKNFLESEIQYSLKNLNFAKEKIESFLEKYKQFDEYINAKENEHILDRFDSSINLKKLIDVEWRNEYLLSSKYLNKINKDVFYINLKVVNEQNEVEEIPFQCELEELTSLVDTINIACKCIENASDLKHLNFNK